MSTEATLDFETYSEAGYVWDEPAQKWRAPPGFAATKRGLEVVGLDNYVAHPTFRPLSLAYALPGGPVVRWVPPTWLRPIAYSNPDNSGHPDALLDFIYTGGVVEAWNVGFEARVWEWCVENWGWPLWLLVQQRCAMARSRAAAYPGGLDNAAEVLGTERKDEIGKRLIRKLTVPKNPTKKDAARRWTPETAPQDFELFYQYNEQDVRAEIAASARLPDLTPFELDVWRLDQEINRRGMMTDVAGRDNCIVILEQATERACLELRQLTGGAVEAPSEVAAMVRWMAWRGVHVIELDEESVTGLLGRDPPLPPDVARVLRIRQQLAFGSVKKLYAMRAQTSADGRLREQYTYHGAHTSLWNGRGVQPANLPRPTDSRFEKPAEIDRALKLIGCRAIELLEFEYPDLDPLEIVSSCLRSLIIAPPGARLISADFNSIQAVVTSCLAGEEWRIEVFQTHGKIYETMGARLTGLSLEEVLAYKTATGKHHPCRQNPGKLAVLSGDFGAWVNGWKRFGADKLLGSDENIKAAIMRTRAAQPAIVELWGGQTRNKFRWDERPDLYGLEGAVVQAIQNPGQAFGYRGTVYQMHGPDLCCKTVADFGENPDGSPRADCMRYHNARLRPSERPYASPWELEIMYEGWNSNATKGAPGWQTMSLYAGVLTQNVVSRVSRMVQAHALLRLKAGGYTPVMHTHDENVCEEPAGRGSTAEHTTLTAILPAWAVMPDGRPWPIKVPESWEGPRYGKW